MLRSIKKYNWIIGSMLLILAVINLSTSILLLKTNAEEDGDTGKFIIERPTLEIAFNEVNIKNTISGGSGHTLAIKSDGTVWAWGSNDSGKLGNGLNVNSNIPVQVSSLTDIVAVSAGFNHSLALMADGTVWSWGYNGFGQLGNETNVSSNIPVRVKDLNDIVAINAGYSHSLALMADGTVWTWGRNEYGQLGDGSEINKNTPIQIKTLTDAISTGASNNHSIALKSDETLWSWGDNSTGQLGDGTNNKRSLPVQVNIQSDVIAVSAGNNHSLALKGDGTLWSWGVNGSGQLGDGTNDNNNIPVKVKNLTNIVSASAGNSHSIALKTDGTIWSWGNNGLGQLGNGTNNASKTPVKAKHIIDTIAVSVGNNHSLAIKSDGTLWSWGANSTGQLGDGTETPKSTPAQIEDFKLWDLKIEIINNPTEWTNEDISLIIRLKDNRGSDEIILPDNSRIIGTTANYTVNQNGEYIFKVKDLSGKEDLKKIVVDKIDKEKPTTPVLTITENNRLDIELGTDSLSGIKEHLYKLSDDEWMDSFDIDNLEDGRYSLGVKAIDNAGNNSDIVSIKFIKIGEKIQGIDLVINEIENKLDGIKTILSSLEDNITQEQIQNTQEELDQIRDDIHRLSDDDNKEELNNKLKDLQNQLYEIIKNIEIAKGIRIEPRSLSLNVNDKKQLIHNSSLKVSWKSSNENIVTVSDEGIVKGISNGNATVTVIIDNTDITDSIVINVINKSIPIETDKPGTVNPTDPIEPIEPIKPDDIEKPDKPEEPIRVDGKNTMEVAVEISKKIYKDGGSKVAVLVGSDSEADVSSGTALANAEDAPMLITYRDKLDEELLKELKRLGVEQVFILGGHGVVDEVVETELYNKGYLVKRLAGDNRGETAIEIAKHVYRDKSSTEAFIVQHNGLADALAIGPAAAIKNAPVLLTKIDVIPHTTIEALEDLHIKKVTIIGGSTAVSNKIIDTLPKGIDIDRIGGINRTETALLIANKYFKDSKTAIIANGYSYTDAMVGGYFAVKENAPILLTKTDVIEERVLEAIGHNKNKTYILGGEKAISSKVKDRITKILQIKE